jgi:putative oxidoreductase
MHPALSGIIPVGPIGGRAPTVNDASLLKAPYPAPGAPLLPSRGRPQLARWAPIPLRLIVRYGFIAHGYAKIVRGPDVFVGVVHALGVPAPYFMGWATIVLELVCGLAVLIGAFLPLASVPMVVILLVAMLAVHLPYGFTSIKLVAVTGSGPQFGPPGYECDLLYLACLAALLMTGPGPWSIDRLRESLQRLQHKRDAPARAVRADESVRDPRTTKLSVLVIVASLLGAVFAPANEASAQPAFRHAKVRDACSRRFTEDDPFASCVVHNWLSASRDMTAHLLRRYSAT